MKNDKTCKKPHEKLKRTKKFCTHISAIKSSFSGFDGCTGNAQNKKIYEIKNTKTIKSKMHKMHKPNVVWRKSTYLIAYFVCLQWGVCIWIILCISKSNFHSRCEYTSLLLQPQHHSSGEEDTKGQIFTLAAMCIVYKIWRHKTIMIIIERRG